MGTFLIQWEIKRLNMHKHNSNTLEKRLIRNKILIQTHNNTCLDNSPKKARALKAVESISR